MGGCARGGGGGGGGFKRGLLERGVENRTVL